MAAHHERHRAELAARDGVIADQAKTIARQADRITQLERQVRRDSNSSRPPSSDSPFTKQAKGKDRSRREKTGRRPGKQLVDDPDEVIECRPGECDACGTDLTEAPDAGMQRRQQWDIAPPPPPVTKEFQVFARVCSCCGRPRLAQFRRM